MKDKTSLIEKLTKEERIQEIREGKARMGTFSRLYGLTMLSSIIHSSLGLSYLEKGEYSNAYVPLALTAFSMSAFGYTYLKDMKNGDRIRELESVDRKFRERTLDEKIRYCNDKEYHYALGERAARSLFLLGIGLGLVAATGNPIAGVAVGATSVGLSVKLGILSMKLKSDYYWKREELLGKRLEKHQHELADKAKIPEIEISSIHLDNP